MEITDLHEDKRLRFSGLQLWFILLATSQGVNAKCRVSGCRGEREVVCLSVALTYYRCFGDVVKSDRCAVAGKLLWFGPEKKLMWEFGVQEVGML